MKSGACPNCGSRVIIEEVPVADRGHGNRVTAELSTYVARRPGAVFFKNLSFTPLRAWICEACGYTELYCSDPKRISDAIRRLAYPPSAPRIRDSRDEE